jgi:DNA-binding GntR family transcriptional regulator
MDRVTTTSRRSAAAEPAAGQRPIRRQTVTALTVEALREKILRGDYPEGAPLRQDTLAAELGVSRIPVREALRQLEAEGLVTFVPHFGAVVSSLSLSEIKELFELRALLETDLLRRAIPRIREEELDRADEILDQYDTAIRERNVALWGELNWRFHSTLLLPADRPLTMGVVQNLKNQSDRYTRLQLSLTHRESRAAQEHREIARAVRERDVEQACALLAAHIISAGRVLVEFLREHRSRSEEGS